MKGSSLTEDYRRTAHSKSFDFKSRVGCGFFFCLFCFVLLLFLLFFFVCLFFVFCFLKLVFATHIR